MTTSSDCFVSTPDAISAGFIQIDRDGKVISVNQNLCEVLGYSKAELIALNFDSIFKFDNQKTINEVFMPLISQEVSAISFEKLVFRKDGRQIWVRVISTSLLDENKKPKCFLSIVDEITNVKKIEKEVADKKIQMVAASKINSIRRIAAGVAHEINNPLTIVMGQASRLKKMAEEKKLNDVQVLNMSEQIESMALRIVEIVNGLRSFAREGSDEPIVSTSLKEILKKSLKFSRAKILTNRIELIVDERATDLTVKCRGVQVVQALFNVINNARDAVEGQKSARIEIKIITEEKMAGFEVHDNGPGVSEAAQRYLFQPFFTTKAVGLGSGLGLSITKDIVDKYDGEISYRRSHLGGACFKILLRQ